MNPSPANPPRFSVILPTHNRRDMLREAAESVARQTFTDWELIVADDASRDPIREDELRTWAGPNTRVVRLSSSQGGAAAKSAGAAAARGQLLAFLDDDDLWEPDYLERANSVFERMPDVRVLFMGVKWFGERAPSGQQAQERGMGIIQAQTGSSPDANGVHSYDDNLFGALLERVPMPFQRPVMLREDYLAIGPYRTECLLWDCDWALRAALHGNCALLEAGLYLQRAAGQGYSSQDHRALEHTCSNLEIKEALLRHPTVRGSRREQLVRQALHRDWMSYAWQLRNLGEAREALGAVRNAARYGLSPELAWMLARVGVAALREGAK